MLDGVKTFVTNGPVADLAIVFATVDPSARAAGVTAFLVERGAPGLSSRSSCPPTPARSPSAGPARTSRRGRRDHMVKVRGHRVELGEIEAALAEHPAVREAVAVALPDAAAGNRLFAAVVAGAGATVDRRALVAALLAHLAARLPRYMLPERVDVLAELPRTSNGKADRARLRERWERGEDHGGDLRAEPG